MPTTDELLAELIQELRADHTQDAQAWARLDTRLALIEQDLKRLSDTVTGSVKDHEQRLRTVEARTAKALNKANMIDRQIAVWGTIAGLAASTLVTVLLKLLPTGG